MNLLNILVVKVQVTILLELLPLGLVRSSKFMTLPLEQGNYCNIFKLPPLQSDHGLSPVLLTLQLFQAVTHVTTAGGEGHNVTWSR